MIKSIITVFLVFLASLVLCEFFAHIYLNIYASPFVKAKRILQVDEYLLWKQKENANETFLGKDFITNADGFRSKRETEEPIEILFLGPSSTMGWGVEQKDSYAEVLSGITEKRIFNAGQIGYTIEQGYRLFTKYFESNTHLKTIVLAYGVNDIDYFPFFMNTKTMERSWFLEHSTSLFLAQNSWENLKLLYPCPKNFSLSHRVGEAKFIEFLENFAKIASEKGIKLVILNSAQNYINYQDTSKSQRSNELYNKFRESLKKGQCSSARSYFFKAQQYEPYRVSKEIKDINNILDKFSRKHKIEILSLDTLLSFRQEMFLDPVHFSKKGHQVIAHELAKILK